MKAKKNKFKTMSTTERINFFAKIFAGVFAVSMVAFVGVNTSDYNVSVAKNQSELKTLENEFNMIQDRSVTQEQAVVILNSASEAGNKIADIQNNYMNSGSFDKDSILNYFVENEDVTPWYHTDNYENIVWEFNTNYSFTMSDVPVLWTLYAEVPNDVGSMEKTLFAYTTATYYVDTNSFGNVSVNITAAGQEAVVKNSSGSYNLDSDTDSEPTSVFTDTDGVGLTYLEGIWFEPDWTPRYIYDEKNDTLIAYSAEKYQNLYHKSIDDIAFPGENVSDVKGVDDNENNPE